MAKPNWQDERRVRQLEKAADVLMSSPKAKQARYRIENQTFTEEHGRSMYKNIAGSSGRRSRAAAGYPVPPLSIEAGRDVIRHSLFGGRPTPSAIVSRICALAVQMGELSIYEAAKISKKSQRTIKRNGKS